MTVDLRHTVRLLLGGPLATARRARLVRGSAQFALREAIRRRSTRCYRLRESGLAVCIRHATPDVYGLDQAFLERHFDLTPDVRAALGDVRSPRVVDLGANIGLFGIRILAEYPGATITAFEPDPTNAAVLRQVVRANDAADRWRVVEAVAATREGSVRFELGRYGVSRVAAEGEAGVEVPAHDVFTHLDGVDLLKLDIEGAEWEIVRDARFAGISARAIHFEYHRRLAPSDDPERAATELLESRGYRVAPLRRHSPVEGILWAWRAS